MRKSGCHWTSNLGRRHVALPGEDGRCGSDGRPDGLEKTRASPEIVTDNGSQFTAKDFKEVVRDFEPEHIRIRTYHPESNGKLE